MKTKFKYVDLHRVGGKTYWRCTPPGVKPWSIRDTGSDSMAQAAKEVDIRLIQMGKDPVNILKRKVV